jgi:uncharacterized protein (DUF885 family)
MKTDSKYYGVVLCIFFLSTGGVVANFVETLEWQEDVASSKEAAENFICRLNAFPQQVEQYIELLRLGVLENRVASKDMLRKTCEQIEVAANDLSPIEAIISKLMLTDDDDHKNTRKRISVGMIKYQEACFRLEQFFRNEYMPHARTVAGCTGLPTDGAEIYSLCLKFHTTTTLGPEEVHSIGLKEVERIQYRYQNEVLVPLKYMDRVNVSVIASNFEERFAQFVSDCRNNEDYYYNTEEELLTGYRQKCSDIRNVLPQYFNIFPKSPLEIVSKNASTAPAAYYLAGTPDGTRPGRFYVNVSNLNQRPKYEMTSLALHEAIPGHHHQCALALENENVPDFLRFLEDRRYEFCPARRQLYAAYLEGWALYCEALGEEMGVYSSEIELFGKLSMEMMRAVRLVVDSGIHYKGWTVERAMDYMMKQTGMHRHEVEAECYRYEAWPGQATAYKIGEICIWRMRSMAEERLGERFNVKQFHDVILGSGPMPLDTLERMVEKWVTDSLESVAESDKKKRRLE